MNYWVIALLAMMYLTSVSACSNPPQAIAILSANATVTALGITLAYQSLRPDSILRNSQVINFSSPYFFISLLLNLLTFMIVVRLVLHSGDV